MISTSRKVTFADNQIVVNQSDKQIQHLFVVLNGLAKNIVMNENQEEIIIKTYGRGEVFGLIHAMSGEGFSYTIRAVNQVEFLFIPLSNFESLMSKYPTFTEEVARLITSRLRELYKQLEKETSFPSTQQGSPYRKKVIEFMTQPVLTCKKEDHIIDVSQTIISQGVGSIIVVDGAESPIGIITEKDLIKTFTRQFKQQEPSYSTKQTLHAEQTMKSPLITISPDAFYFDALHLMLKHNIKHLPVVDQNIVVGMVTTKNLIHSFSNHSLRLIKEIESMTTLEQLFPMKSHVDQMLQEMILQHATAKELAAIITEINERITKKIISIAEKEMKVEGYEHPPVSYCWISLGSEGRKEQTLQTDQDNAIIYADVVDEQKQQVDQYFKRLATKVVEYLDQYGFPKCTGGVMATNPQWRNSVSDWVNNILLWYQKRSPEMIRQFTIFYDFRPIYGDRSLCDQVRTEWNLHTPPSIFQHQLAEDEARVEVAINRFGRFAMTKKGNFKAWLILNMVGSCISSMDYGCWPSKMESMNSIHGKELKPLEK
ncbi:DUF294 nucleotidyltransferase-like domain-containing protein [Tepidibacillus marianensis]|uniref:DUF294 nucleotidyltransferase-like domain-containing protein n=1 Tax=Tepidibacillus marianensis TaxID=3131995 RepID=UPI0030D2FC11